ncbi:phytanoyl-CoA dioxygenase family protein [Bradyrhizobium tropiciagri]|uniref:phytanoyl-CoA dioxygenase family protein n=1 Tax=Bradyrhizobium tropiciagri TaxID=312253 RepID=UPI001BAB9A50|nr:phytanoyl-CoA dioxygenase family protein [Bradyrhizobium tropiciagri]MBR0875140.1 phytanoyl-CoA dioxygenase family protein [Bradyrhizobium tropiciagri]
MTTIDSLSDTAPTARAADIRELPIPPYRGSVLPEIDYDAHPAYGRMLPKPTLAERFQALKIFVRTFAFVTIRRIVDYENMPLLSKEAGFTGLNASTALRYITMYARIRGSRIIGSLTGARRPAIPANPALLNKIKSDGIVCLNLTPDELDQIRVATKPAFDKLDDRRAHLPPEKRKFDDNVFWCTRSADPGAFATVDAIFKRYGIAEAASAYLGRPVGVKHVNAQINDQDLAFWRRVFPDTQLTDPWGSYLHVDATYGMLKCAIYVHDIGPDGGPFCYIRGSHNAKVGWFEGMVRRTNDFSGFSSRKPETRKKLMALPAFLRKKADFGGDLVDDSPDVPRLREGHFSATSNYGNCILFDGNGIHRGGMVNSGERRCLFIVLAEI